MKANCYGRLSRTQQSLNNIRPVTTALSGGSLDKGIHSSHAEKFTESMTVRTCLQQRRMTSYSGTPSLHTSDFQAVADADAANRRVKVVFRQFDIRRSRSQGQWSLLSLSVSVTKVAVSYMSGLQQIYLSAKQSPSAQDFLSSDEL